MARSMRQKKRSSAAAFARKNLDAAVAQERATRLLNLIQERPNLKNVWLLFKRKPCATKLEIECACKDSFNILTATGAINGLPGDCKFKLTPAGLIVLKKLAAN